MYMKTFMCTTAIQFTYKKGQSVLLAKIRQKLLQKHYLYTKYRG